MPEDGTSGTEDKGTMEDGGSVPDDEVCGTGNDGTIADEALWPVGDAMVETGRRLTSNIL